MLAILDCSYRLLGSLSPECAPMTCEACSFETERLSVSEWQAQPTDQREQDLVQVVVSVLTERVTRTLPTPWQGDYDAHRAGEWIADRNREGPTLLAVERSTGQAVGFVILFESITGCGNGVDVRLGYVLAESAWGKGLASELIEGFVRWCRTRAEIRSLVGGVGKENAASVRVLEKNGFVLAAADRCDRTADQIFLLRLQP